MDTPADRRRSEAGDNLVEVLLAIVVLGLTSVALLAAFGTIISSSAEYRGLPTMDTVLRSASQQAISQVGQQPGALFASCESAARKARPGELLSSCRLHGGGQFGPVLGRFGHASRLQSTLQLDRHVLQPLHSQCGRVAHDHGDRSFSGQSSTIRSVVDNQQGRPVSGAGAVSQVVFYTEPGNGTPGTNLSPQPAVAVEDDEGNIVYSDLSDIKLTISGGPSGATLSDTCTGSEFYGVVTFSDCSVNMAGTGYSLTATDGALQSATSSTFNVTAGAALQAAITSAPLDVAPASSASGNPTTGASPIAVTLSSTTPGGGTAEFASSSGGSSLDSVSLPANTRAVTDYNAYSEGLKSPVITASGTGMTSGTQTETTT